MHQQLFTSLPSYNTITTRPLLVPYHGTLICLSLPGRVERNKCRFRVIFELFLVIQSFLLEAVLFECRGTSTIPALVGSDANAPTLFEDQRQWAVPSLFEKVMPRTTVSALFEWQWPVIPTIDADNHYYWIVDNLFNQRYIRHVPTTVSALFFFDWRLRPVPTTISIDLVWQGPVILTTTDTNDDQ